MTIAIIGAGPTGIEAAAVLASQHNVTIFEKEDTALRNIRNKAFLFPDFSSADELADKLESKLNNPNIKLKTNSNVESVSYENSQWILKTESEQSTFDAVLIATGYDVFNAKIKEELGYGIYEGVITSLDLEAKIKNRQILNNMGEKPKNVVFLQCVGSRDEKTGNNYCSKVCCVTAVKQAIEVKKQSPETDVFVFYMDLRMWGQGFEEMYREAQEKYGVNFVRGRISEAAATFDRRVQLKAEDTLLGNPLTLSTDLLVLMVGMCPSDGSKNLAEQLQISGLYGFAESASPHLGDNLTNQPRLYLAGACKRPVSINDSIQDARAAACQILLDLSK